MQVPVRAHAPALGNLPRPRGVARLHQLHAALVHLGLKIHGGKQALGAGQRVEQEVAQLRKLVDGHGRLAYKDQIARERTYVGESLDAEHAARHGDDGIIDVANHDGHGHHGVGVAHGGGAGAAKLVVAAGGSRATFAASRLKTLMTFWPETISSIYPSKSPSDACWAAKKRLERAPE